MMIMENIPQLEPISDSGHSRGRVLICDDDVTQREVLAIILQKNGFETIDTGLGGECLHFAASEQISALLLDIDLPDASGLDICEEISDAQRTHQLPIILVSGMQRADLVRSARRRGARFFLQKPYDPAALIALLERALDETSPW